MKKLLTLCTAMMLAVMASAQVDETFQFVDAQGNVVADGTTIVVNQLNAEGQMVVPLWAKNASGEKAAVSIYETIDAKPNGVWQTCAFGNCMMLSESGYSPKNIMAADYNNDIETEWIPEQGQYATWEATLEIHVFNIVSTTRFGQTIETAGTEVIGYGPKVTVRFEYTDPKGGEPTGTWWGYAMSNAETYGLGVQKAETYDCAIFVPANHVIAAGKTINAVRFELKSENVSNVKVWIAEGTKPSNVDDAKLVVAVENPASGYNEVALPTPYTLGKSDIFVGYTFTITKIADDKDKYPVSLTDYYIPNSLWLRTSATSTSWSDLGSSYGALYMQLLLDGEFLQNAIGIDNSNVGDYTAAIGGKATVYLPVTNLGTEPVTSLEYSITSNNGGRERGSVNLSSQPIAFGESRTLTIEVSGDDTVGGATKTITVSKVNGQKNENGNAQTQFTLITVGKLVARGIAVEEFTGTQCGWCPRGIAGMGKLREKYGDKFVGAAVHGYANGTSDDAMYLTNWGSRYAKIFSGAAPSCQLNRAYGEIDPYYGTGSDICRDFEDELKIPARVGISLKGEWSEDSTKVIATADLEAVVDNQSYTIEYALIADSLTGTSSAWNQANYYASRSSDDPNIAKFCNGGQYGLSTLKGWTFYDVVIATCYSGGKNQTTAPGKLEMGKTVTNSYTLSMPTDNAHANLMKAIDKSKVAVVAFVIGSDGTVANAAKFYMPGQGAGITGDVNGDGAVDVADISSVITVMASGDKNPKADVNGDGSVDVADISAIVTIMAQ